MTLREHLASLRGAWKIIVGLTLVGAVVGASLALVLPAKYVSTTRFFVASAVNSEDPEELFNRNQIATQRVLSYVELIGSDLVSVPVAERVAETDPDALDDAVEVTAVLNTVIIDLTVTGDSPKAAQKLAQAYGEVVPGLVDEVESVGSQEAAQVALTVVDQPDLGRAVAPGLLRSVFFGLLLGLILGTGGSVLWGAIRREDETSGA